MGHGMVKEKDVETIKRDLERYAEGVDLNTVDFVARFIALLGVGDV